MNKLILPVIIVISVLFIVAGMIGDNKEAMENSAVIEITGAQELDDLVAQGPVLVEIGAEWCPACTAQKPIMADISLEYEGKASVVYLNTDKAGTLAASFNVYSIPDSFIIVENSENGYIYMGDDGQTTTDRISARHIGLTSKGTFTDALDNAIEYRRSAVD
ncbi:thioredoxin family protein [Methanolobus bombayensis]|uniref:thioredoxin family protein n=1 Tax=Methanolobus bombayensis TaxID=38023 RepID=UPI001AEABEF7|nr:thioredoxin domain-containing protein [Methanolobus bombayensis]MBP1907968.1 thiol-disulfide isomerase/thioredoxin [Methanolobus bombayensis]